MKPAITIALVLTSTAGSGPRALAETVDFSRDVRPILAENCYECHGPDEEARRAGLRLDTGDGAFGASKSGAVIVPGDPVSSLLVARLESHDTSERMPPPDSPRQPSTAEIEILKRWISEGASFDRHWAFVPPIGHEAPTVTNDEWPRGDLDRFVLALLETEGLAPRPDAEPTVLARRLSLALTGLPASPRALEEFVSRHDVDPDAAVCDWVDRLLASPAYGEHLAWSWLDAARYADTNGYQGDGDRVMWPWRDWLVRALNDNLPFDEMTERMLAGDLMVPGERRVWESGDWIEDSTTADLLLATGFLRNHRYDTGSGTIPAEAIFENATDRLETVSTVWTGLTMQCARCHSHKFDPITNGEYYGLLSYFDNVPEVGSALKGASHPYIRVAAPGQHEGLQRSSDESTRACTEFQRAMGNLSEHQARWERSLDGAEEFAGEAADKAATEARVRRGLRHRFAAQTIEFDGRTTIRESKAPVGLCAGNRRWTISFWFRAANDRDGAIFSSVQEPERYRPGIQADWVGGRARVRHVCRWVNSYIEFESRERLEPGRWYHVTFRCDGRMQGLAYRASLDGEDQAMRCTHAVTNDSAGRAGKAPLVLGGSPLMPGFVGSLRDLRFYDRLLDSVEVKSLADARQTREIARVPPAERSRREIETLRLAFLESDALPRRVARLRESALAASEALRTKVQAQPTVMVMKEVDRGATHVRRMGAYDQLGETVSSGTPGFLPPMPDGRSTRLELARWLTDSRHPLTARVAVNRIWQLLWGRGFVDSPENFGMQCARPRHAVLLDWLATEYIRSGWDTKAVFRLIATSRAYRQSSSAASDLWRRDPGNRLLGRGPRFRLPIQVIRDQALALSGRLDSTLGGPPVILDQVTGKDERAVKLPYEVSDRRRTLYTFWKRNAPHGMLAVFDVADRNQCEVRAPRTNTPLQALVTLNESSLAACAEELGQRARAEFEGDAGRIRWLWLACTGREPEQAEASRLAATLDSYRRLAGEEGAWFALSNVLLNLDATLTLE